MDITVQELLQSELMEQSSDDNEMLEVLEFVRQNGVPLTKEQAQAIFMLNSYGMSDVANYIINVRPQMTAVKKYYDMTNKLTLADRIKGNAKLGNLLKANANPANSLNVDKALSKDGGKL